MSTPTEAHKDLVAAIYDAIENGEDASQLLCYSEARAVEADRSARMADKTSEGIHALAIVRGLRERVRVLELAARPCPNVVSSKEGTQYCALAESSVAKLEAQLAAARKDSARLDWLERNPEMSQCYDEGDPDVGVFGHWDVSRHIGKHGENLWEPVSQADTLRDAIDAAMTNSNHKTT